MSAEAASDDALDLALASLEAEFASNGFAAAPRNPPFFALAALLALTEGDFDLAAAVFETNEGRSGACSIPTLSGQYVLEGTLASHHPDSDDHALRALCTLELTLVIGDDQPLGGESISHHKEVKVCEDEDVGGHLRLLFEEGLLLRKLRDQALRA